MNPPSSRGEEDDGGRELARNIPGMLSSSWGDLREAGGAAGAAAVVLCLLVWLAFRGALGNGFVNYDDPVYVTGNPHLAGFSAANLRWMFTDTNTVYWHPLTYLWHAAEIAAFGMDASRHHLTSVLLHAAGTVTLFVLTLAVLRLTAPGRDPAEPAADRVLLAAGAALLFAVHPLRVESVAWASQKKDLLSAGLYAGALLAWLHRGTAPDIPSRRRRGAAAHALLALGLAAKPMALTLPAAFLLLDWYPLRRLRRPADLPPLLREKALAILLVVLAVVPSLVAPRQANLLPTATEVVPGERLATVARGVAAPLLSTVAPGDLVAFVPATPPGTASLADPAWGGPALLLLAITGLCALAAARGTRAPLAAWLFYLLAVAPVGGLRQAGAIATADRFAFVPTMALVPLLAGGALLLLARARRGPPVAPVALGASLALAVLGTALVERAATARQIGVWRDSVTLWEPVVARHGESVPIPRVNLALGWSERALRTADPGLLDRARGELARAEALFPGEGMVLSNRGIVEMAAGRHRTAEAYLRRAAVLDPENGVLLAHLAGAEAELGRPEDAARRLERAEGATRPPPAELARFVRGRVEAARKRAAEGGN